VVVGLFGDNSHPNVSLGTLATLGRMLRDEPFVQALGEARNPEDVYRLLEEKETKKGS
jgi:mannitol/fructose-specific phosphotransferase system IIA component (Ntr-type)